MSSVPTSIPRGSLRFDDSPESPASSVTIVDLPENQNDLLALDSASLTKERLRAIALSRLEEARQRELLMKQQIEMLSRNNKSLIKRNEVLEEVVTERGARRNSVENPANSSIVEPPPLPPRSEQAMRGPNDTKSAVPERFNGTDRIPTISNWLFAVRKYLRVTKAAEVDKVEYATTYFTGTALDWWHSVEDDEGEAVFRLSWSEFEERCIKRFQAVNDATASLRKVVRWKQTGAVSSYIAGFQALVQPIPVTLLPHSTRVFLFIEGLTTELQKAVQLMEPTTVDQAMAIAQRTSINSQFTKAGNPPFQRTPYRQNSSFNRSNSQTQRTVSNRFAPLSVENIEEAESDPIGKLEEGESWPLECGEVELSYMNAEQRKLFKEGKCFKCKKAGHRSFDCRSPPQSTKDQARA